MSLEQSSFTYVAELETGENRRHWDLEEHVEQREASDDETPSGVASLDRCCRHQLAHSRARDSRQRKLVAHVAAAPSDDTRRTASQRWSISGQPAAQRVEST
jgi:hypothetical protein